MKKNNWRKRHNLYCSNLKNNFINDPISLQHIHLSVSGVTQSNKRVTEAQLSIMRDLINGIFFIVYNG